MLVTDNVLEAVFAIDRIADYRPNAPLITYEPNSLSFGSVVVGTSSAPQSVTLTNSGSAPLTFAAILASQDFTQSNTCGSSLAPGTDCTIPVTFTPTALGAKAGAVTITDSATGSPHTVALSGNGTDFTIAPAAGAPTSATVSSGGVADFHLALSGTSGFNGTVTLSCSGAPDYATCYLPPSVLLTDTNPVDVTVRVATTARGTIGPQHQPRSPMSNYRGFPFLVCLTLVLMAGLAGVAWAWRVAASKGLPSYPSARRASRRWRPAGALLFVVMLGTALMGGCGGSGTEERSGSTGTPAGTYTLEVTGQFATETSITTHDIELTLTVN
jgi:hypothetical protein